MSLTLTNAQSSDYVGSISDVDVDSMTTDGVTGEETSYSNTNWSKQWGLFNKVPNLKAALISKARWIVGRGYTCSARDKVILDHISGWGKDDFKAILFNMCVVSRIGGDAYAEIIRDGNLLINLKPLDPSTMKIIVGPNGLIKRYEQTAKSGKITKFEPTEIFHISNNRLADQIHGISDIDVLEATILADNESFVDTKKTMHYQARPLILWKLKTDNASQIASFVTKIQNARNLGEDMFIPDDDETVSHEVVQVSPNQMLAVWRDDLRKQFYRTIDLPELLPSGGGDATESGGKIGYLSFEQTWASEQLDIENAVWQQLYIKIKLNPPTSMAQSLATDTAKDGVNQQLNIQPSDMTAGVGR